MTPPAPTLSLAALAALMLVTYVPGFAMWLPNLLLK